MKTPEIEANLKAHKILEKIPGLTSWLFLLSPAILSLIDPIWVAYLIIGYDIYWLIKGFAFSYRLVFAYLRLHRYKQINWRSRLNDLRDISTAIKRANTRLKRNRLSHWRKKDLIKYRDHLKQLASSDANVLDPDQLIHAVLVTVYKEPLEVVEPTIDALMHADYPLDKMWLYLAYEERGGEATEKMALYLLEKYGHYFGHAEAVSHPKNLPGEIIGKGGNINYAGQKLLDYAKQQKMALENVIVTTLDADHRPVPNYFAYLGFVYATTPDRIHRSYQPIPMLFNNIWDVPAPMRVIAVGNSFWVLMESLRPRRLRNFAAHAQSLQTLSDTNLWSGKTVVEDGHQFWRTYFTYDGNHSVVPIYTIIFQDAVLADGYLRTFRAQFMQLRRWAYGASDFPYVVINSWRNKKISWGNKLTQIARLFEGHFSWATAPLVIALAAWMPLLLNTEIKDQVLAHQLPVIAGRIQTVASLGLVATILISLIALPPRPARYKRHHSVFMVLQWVLLPFTTIFFSAFAAINAQTRLLFGWYLEKFDFTEKAVKK